MTDPYDELMQIKWVQLEIPSFEGKHLEPHQREKCKILFTSIAHILRGNLGILEVHLAHEIIMELYEASIASMEQNLKLLQEEKKRRESP